MCRSARAMAKSCTVRRGKRRVVNKLRKLLYIASEAKCAGKNTLLNRIIIMYRAK